MSSPARTPASRSEEWRFEETGDPCEWSEDSRPGGFHPVNIGDIFKDGRYRVIRKLGYGSFSTVWLVVDNDSPRYLAMKIMMAKQSSFSDTELEIDRHLAERASSNVSQSKHVALSVDNFKHVGPNGIHLCLCYQPMGGTVASMIEKLRENQHIKPPKGECLRYPTWMAKLILKHILLGLSFLHQNSVVHGDIQPGNFLFPTSNLDSLKEEESKQSESHITAPLQRCDGKIDRWAPRHLMLPQSLYKYADLGPGMFIKTSDLGAAFWSSNPPKETVTPVALRAPELIFGEPFGSPIDIWSFGCLIYELLTGLRLFGVWMMGDDSQEEADDDHLMELNDVLEPLPDSWLHKWPRSHLFFGPNRERLDPPAEKDIDIGGDDEQNAEYLERLGGVFDSEDGGMTPIEGDRDDVSNGDGFRIMDDPYPNFENDAPFINERLEVLFEKNKPADMSTAEAEVVTSLIRQILQYDASGRPTVAQLLEHEWFKD
ncbi:CMGC/SRPK protein kinase [Emergomyces pasteurianus Ep9510]|uniref:non-specific serine/threonine protein kinase n=1 Tax=Emergomyces pasteurianus Ep9510 TaxID=1447872 RepID=A0A1J9Q9T3_9EURO|nr:CMGC/SRPK protein kinase [Emergomyces pasteurianus Ep9510]